MSAGFESTTLADSMPVATVPVNADWLSLKELGNVAYGLGDTATAITEYEKSLAAAPDDTARVALYGNLALAHLRAGQLSSAVARCDEGLALSPDSEKLLFRKAKALVQLKDGFAADAIARLEAAHRGSKGAAELRALLPEGDASAAASSSPGTAAVAAAAAPAGASQRALKSDSLRKAMAAAMSSGSLYEDKPQAKAAGSAGTAGRGSGFGSDSGLGSMLSACWDALCCRRKRGAPARAPATGSAAEANAKAKDKSA